MEFKFLIRKMGQVLPPSNTPLTHEQEECFVFHRYAFYFRWARCCDLNIGHEVAPTHLIFDSLKPFISKVIEVTGDVSAIDEVIDLYVLLWEKQSKNPHRFRKRNGDERCKLSYRLKALAKKLTRKRTPCLSYEFNDLGNAASHYRNSRSSIDLAQSLRRKFGLKLSVKIIKAAHEDTKVNYLRSQVYLDTAVRTLLSELYRKPTAS